MRISRRLFATLAVIVFGLFVAHGHQPVQAQEVPFEINVIVALTGAAAFIGKSEQQSLQFVEVITNKAGGIKGRPIKFVMVDDQSNPQVSVQLANQLISKGVPVILGPTFTSTCLAVSAIVAKTGPVEYCFSPSVSPPSGGFAYSASVATHDDLVAILRFFREKGWTRIALMTTTDASGQQAEQYFDDAMTRPENKVLRQVAREHFNPSDLSVTAQAERIKTANPQAMVGWTAGTATGTLLRGLHDAAIDIPIVAGNGPGIRQPTRGYLRKSVRSAILPIRSPSLMHANRTSGAISFRRQTLQAPKLSRKHAKSTVGF
jgi:branched-chain amino acid transport system substrate-binding protein